MNDQKSFASSNIPEPSFQAPALGGLIEQATGLVDYVRATRRRQQQAATTLGFGQYTEGPINDNSGYQDMAMKEMLSGGRSYLQTLANALEILREEADTARNIMGCFEAQTEPIH